MKKMNRVIAALSAVTMLAICAAPASAAITTRSEFGSEALSRLIEEYQADCPPAAEIDASDPNYVILTELEKRRVGGLYSENYFVNDEEGNLVEHCKYIPEEGGSVRTKYQRFHAETGALSIDIDNIVWVKCSSIIVNPYKAIAYRQRTVKDLKHADKGIGTTFHYDDILPTNADYSLAINRIFISGQGEYLADGGKEYQEAGNTDIFMINYFLNDDGEAVIVNVDNRLMPDQLAMTVDWIVPTALSTADGTVPVAEILPGAYAHLVRMGTEDSAQLLYYDPMSEEEPVSLVAEVKFGDGDITEDGEFTVSDAVYSARMIAEDKTLQVSDAGRAAADMDASGRVDTKDLSLMLDLLAAYNN